MEEKKIVVVDVADPARNDVPAYRRRPPSHQKARLRKLIIAGIWAVALSAGVGFLTVFLSDQLKSKTQTVGIPAGAK